MPSLKKEHPSNSDLDYFGRFIDILAWSLLFKNGFPKVGPVETYDFRLELTLRSRN